MKYLARTTSDAELNKVVARHMYAEGSSRRGTGQLRNEQEQLEFEVSNQMHSLTDALQADAHAKAQAKARAAAAAKQAAKQAEQAARTMGAVAPHRAAARDAALAVVAPRDSFIGQTSPQKANVFTSSPQKAASTDVSAHVSVLLAEHSACLTLKPGKYFLRTTATATGADAPVAADQPPAEQTFLTHAAGVVKAGGEKDKQPWLVRQLPSGHRACTFTTSGSAKLFASAAGALSVGEPPRHDLSQFLVIPQNLEAAAGGALVSPRSGGDMQQPSPRPFSSAPRVMGGAAAQAPVASPRPQTAVAAGPAPAATAQTPLIVRLFHPPSRRFLTVDPTTGVPSLPPAPVNTANAHPALSEIKSKLPVPHPGQIFELVRADQAPSPRSNYKGSPKRLAQQVVHAQATAARTGQGAVSTLPLRGFDMATGLVRGDELVEPLPPRSWSSPNPMLMGSLGSVGREADVSSLAPSKGGGCSSAAETSAAYVARLKAPSAHATTRPPPQEDETRKTAWDASQLDLSDVMAGGPLRLGNLFATGGGAVPTHHHQYNHGALRGGHLAGPAGRVSRCGLGAPGTAPLRLELPSLPTDGMHQGAMPKRAPRFQLRK